MTVKRWIDDFTFPKLCRCKQTILMNQEGYMNQTAQARHSKDVSLGPVWMWVPLVL